MSWTSEKHRWRKMYRGRTYTVYCSELDLPEDQWTELGSYQAANEWWIAKRAEIDGRMSKPALPEEAEAVLGKLRLKKQYAEREGLGGEASAYAAALIDAEERAGAGEVDLPDVDPMIVRRLQFLEQMGCTFPPDLDPTALDIAFGSKDLWDDRLRRGKAVAASKQIGPHLDNWYALVHRKAKPSSITNIHAYYQEFQDLRSGSKLVLHRSTDIEVINEAKFEEVFQAIAGQDGSPATKKKKWAYFKQFVAYLCEKTPVPLPKNFRSKLLVFRTPITSKAAPDVAAIRTFLDALPDRLKLYALLALNCGSNNIDIGLLRHRQIDWDKGTLTRKRVKTEDNERVPTVTYALWPETLRLLRQECNPKAEFVLTTPAGECLYVARKVGDKAKLYDRVKTQWRDYFGRGEGKLYTLKQFRFFGADLLKANLQYRSYHEPFLGHSPKSTADRNYSSSEDVTVACQYLETLFYPKPKTNTKPTQQKAR